MGMEQRSNTFAYRARTDYNLAFNHILILTITERKSRKKGDHRWYFVQLCQDNLDVLRSNLHNYSMEEGYTGPPSNISAACIQS